MKRMNLQGSKSYKRIYFSVILLLLTVMLLFSLFFYARFIKRQKKTSEVVDSVADLLLFETLKYAVIIVSSVPMLTLYPALQRYFVKGTMVGSLKG